MLIAVTFGSFCLMIIRSQTKEIDCAIKTRKKYGHRIWSYYKVMVKFCYYGTSKH